MIFRGITSKRIYEAGPELAEAGEAVIYKEKTDGAILLKVFKSRLTPKDARKLSHLTKQIKKLTTAAFPIELIENPTTGELVGIVIPFFQKAIPLAQLLTASMRKGHKFREEFVYRIKLARLLAQALRIIHNLGLLQADISDTNYLVSLDTHGRPQTVYVIDTNSFQFLLRSKNGNEVFIPSGATIPFTAPELQKADWATTPRTIYSDSFGLAIIIWKLLFNGSHPYSCVIPPDADDDSLTNRIVNYQFPYAPRAPLPPGWYPTPVNPGFSTLPSSIQELFTTTFTAGNPGKRPIPRDWEKALGVWIWDLEPGIVGRSLTFLQFPKLAPYLEKLPELRRVVQIAAGIFLVASISGVGAKLTQFSPYQNQPPNPLVSSELQPNPRVYSPHPEFFPPEVLKPFALEPERKTP